MSEIGLQIISAVRMVAARNPLFVFQPVGPFCEYVSGGKPACNIGHALWDLGLIDATMEVCAFNSADVRSLLGDQLGLHLDPDEIKWLDLVQSSQDAEKPWGEAITFADNFREEMLQDW